jgi:outer membrane protein
MPSLSPTLLRPLLFSAAFGLPLFAQAADSNRAYRPHQRWRDLGRVCALRRRAAGGPVHCLAGPALFASPGSLGMYLYKGQGLRLSAAVTPYTLRFKTDDVNDPQLRRLHSRQMSAMAGINGEYSADWGIVEASVMREVTGHGGGFESRLHYSYPIQAGRFTWVPRSAWCTPVHAARLLLRHQR